MQAVGVAHHVGVNVVELESALRFYRDALGLAEVRRWQSGARQGRLDGLDRLPHLDVAKTEASVVYLAAGGFFVELVAFAYPPSTDALAETRPNVIGRSHVCFRVEGLRALFLALSEEHTFLSRPVMSSSGGLMVKCLDPSGNVVEFIESPGAGDAEPGRVVDVDHYGINVPDLDQAVEFYTDVVGWSRTRRYVPRLSVDAFTSGIDAREAVTEIAFFDAGRCELELLEYPRSPRVTPDEFGVGRAHLGIEVGDVGSALSRLGASVSWLSEPQTSPSGTTVVKGHDANGYALELIDPGAWLRDDPPQAGPSSRSDETLA